MMRQVSKLMPGLAATLYERAMLSPMRPRTARRVDFRYGNAVETRLPYADGWIVVRSWGHGPTVLLLHGWSGSMADMEDYIEPLAARGFRAVAFDAPAHGESDGTRTNLIQCAGALLQVSATQGPIFGAIAHSFGGPTAALAMQRGLRLPRLVMLGSPVSVVELSDLRARKAGVPQHVIDIANRRIADRFGFEWDDLATDRLLDGAEVSLMLVHDRDDRSVPFAHGERMETSLGARLLRTSGLGHDGVLWDRGVIQAVTDFIAA